MNHLQKNLFTKQYICLFIFLFVNFVFAFKYLGRYISYPLLTSTAIIGFQFILWIKRDYLQKMTKYLNTLDFLILVTFIIAFGFIFIKVPVLSLKVDRATVISSFWDNYFDNKYVYFAKSHRGNPPGPMPFYYLLALPFYLIGELGYFSLTGIIAFYFLIRSASDTKQYKTIVLLLIATSLFYLWEVISRSNLLINGTLIVVSINYFFSDRAHNRNFIITSGILCGLFISTRNVFAIPYIIAFLFALKNKNINFRQCVTIGLIAIFTFILTFVPFVINYTKEFLIMNPFVVQGDYLLPFKYTLIFIGLAFVAPFLAKSKMDVYFYSTLVLFLTIVTYFIYHIIMFGFNTSFYESRADLSYFILCLPFALYYLVKQRANIENPANQ